MGINKQFISYEKELNREFPAKFYKLNYMFYKIGNLYRKFVLLIRLWNLKMTPYKHSGTLKQW
jgi:hypothetical protein